MSQRNRLLLAMSILVGGVFVLVRSCNATRPPDAIHAEPHQVSEVVQDLLDPDRFDTRPTSETIPGIFSTIHMSVIEQGNRIEDVRALGSEGIEDLSEVFLERLRFMIVPDLDRDYIASIERGDPLVKDIWYERYFEHEQAVLRNNSFPDMDPSRVQVSLLKLGKGGEVTERQSRFDQGFGITVGRRGDPLPVPENPVANGMLAVEIVMPMMRMDMKTRKMTPAILGYRFAWNSRMQKWIPYKSIVYKSPFSAFAPPRL